MVKTGRCVRCEAHRILKSGDICKRCSSMIRVESGNVAEVAA